MELSYTGYRREKIVFDRISLLGPGVCELHLYAIFNPPLVGIPFRVDRFDIFTENGGLFISKEILSGDLPLYFYKGDTLTVKQSIIFRQDN